MSKWLATVICFFVTILAAAQVSVDLRSFDKKSGVTATVKDNFLSVPWPTSKEEKGIVTLNLENDKPLFQLIQLSEGGTFKDVATNLDPAFILTVGKRDLAKESGWNIFFDRTA